ncbi:hypothetical protein BHF71_03850 [Vulcanibacillus modesticaldus]|uniref:FAD-dependent oxidoreductase n=1 Tax=Vulcanibacillus modesticaldus TaxID=337097 RepID=A0A1D2YSM6_9BACI|nr:NAD(P)/FAD-dependent oxidoreductase [Vulcanibacillus modesticaldus]OEF97277.1 hypothetical protein BHF71_03850 [Vulcanibacillus modesticaldus]
MKYDVIVVGGGPAGILAAIGAKRDNVNVLLIEKNKKLGKKILISGGGRCNFSNISNVDKIISNIPGNGKFLYSIFNQFSNFDLINFFEEELGIRAKVEDYGRVFPDSDDARTIVEALKKYLMNIGVQIMYESTVKEVLTEKNKIIGVQLNDNRIIEAKAVVLAVGGISYPGTGSTGDGYIIAEKLGHKINDLFPSSVPLNSDEKIIREKLLQGISLRDVELSLYDLKGKRIITEVGDMIFTHFGISGPVVFRISRYVSLTQRKLGNVPLKVVIDLFPSKNDQQLFNIIAELINENPNKIIANGLNRLLPEKLIKVILQKLNINQKKMKELHKKDINKLTYILKNFSIQVTGTRSLSEAIVTGGGVNIKEVNPKTLESKLVEGLYFAGELLDIDGYTGGYNIQAAFSSGYVAGKSVGFYSLKQ